MNVKAGDLAIVIRAHQVIEAIGMICEVRSFYGPFSFDSFGVQPAWIIKLPRKVRAVSGNMAEIVLCPDCCLRPVSGLPDTEDTDTKEPIKEVA
jgi:hypothetical protein